MKKHSKISQFVFVTAMAAFAGCSSARADCDSLLKQFDLAISTRSLSTAKSIESQIAIDAKCGGLLVEAQRQRATLELQIAQQLMDGHASPSAYQDLILDADKPEVLWRAAVGVGEMRFSERKFALAANAYERAIEIIKNTNKTPANPGAATIEAVFNRAVEAKMLAANEESGAGSTFVSAAKGRDNTIGGSMSEDMRGFKPKSIPIPIRFETASAKFTPVGEQAAKELLDALREQAPPSLTLVGHTDERGESAYNLKLSDQRVKAVADYLRQGGITAKIATVAKGKSEPLQLPDASDLSREDIWALNRRVVWQRN